MAGSFNRITVVGYLGRDPDVRMLPSGDSVADFTMATTDRRRGSDGMTKELTTWFRVNTFGKLAEIAQAYLKRGSYVLVEGNLAQREYTDRDGAIRQSLEIRAKDVQFLERRDSNEAPPMTGLVEPVPVSMAVGELPF